MFGWLGRQAGGRGGTGADPVQTVTGGLRSLYRRKVLPLEEAYRFHEFTRRRWRTPTLRTSP